MTGIIVSAFFPALLALVEFFANPYACRSLVLLAHGQPLPGDLGRLLRLLTVMALGTIALVLMRWRLNVPSLSEEEASALGVNVRREKLLVIVLTSLSTGAVTAVAGVIGWIGLIVPTSSG